MSHMLPGQQCGRLHIMQWSGMEWSGVCCSKAAPGYANNWKATAGPAASQKAGQHTPTSPQTSDQRALVVQIFSSLRAG